MYLRNLLLGCAFASACLISVCGYIQQVTHAKQELLYQQQLNRYHSFLLADELRQSSDDLTRMARTYVVMGEEKYEKIYRDILAIRNGELPRPVRMERVYWDLVLNYGDKPSPDGKPAALRSLMENAGFSIQELAKLQEAQLNSDSLVSIELTAMNAVKGRFRDSEGNFDLTGPPDIAMAQRIMHDREYHEAKAHIMGPVNEFFELLDNRTARNVEVTYHQVIFWQNLSIVCFVATFCVIIATLIIIYRYVPVVSSGGRK